jgi:hypothetical protein
MLVVYLVLLILMVILRFVITVLGPMVSVISLHVFWSQTKEVRVILARYIKPFLLGCTESNVSKLVNAPAYSLPLLISVKLAPPPVLSCHWYWWAPVALTPNVALAPLIFFWIRGCMVIIGAAPSSLKS